MKKGIPFLLVFTANLCLAQGLAQEVKIDDWERRSWEGGYSGHLHECALNGDIDKCISGLCRQLLDRTDSDGRTFLHIAAICGSEKLCTILLEKGAKINMKDSHDNTPLHTACEKNHEKICTALINSGASLNSFNRDGFSPLHCAAQKANADLIKCLLSAKPDLDVFTLKKGNSTLHIASARGNEVVCSVLLALGASINIRNNDEKTPLDLALENGKLSTAKLIEDDRRILIERSIRLKLSDTLKTLLGESCNVKNDLTFSDGTTALHVASAHQLAGNQDLSCGVIAGYRKVSAIPLSSNEVRAQLELLGTLLEKTSLKVDQKDRYGRTPLHIAAEWGNEDACRFLLQHKAHVDMPVCHHRFAERSYTPLLLSAIYNYNTLVQVFLDELIDKQGAQKFIVEYPTVLAASSENGSDKVVKLLLSYKKRYLSDDSPKEPSYALHNACMQGNLDICKMLLNDGDDPQMVLPSVTLLSDPDDVWMDEESDSGHTPLHCAASAGHREVCELLMRKKVSLDSLTGRKKTALALACEKNHDNIASLLVKNGAAIDDITFELAPVKLCEKLLKSVKKRYAAIPHDERGVREYEDTITALLSRKNADGKTLLHREAERGNPEKVALFLDSFASLSAVDSDGRTPLHLACMNGSVKDRLRFNKPCRVIDILLTDEDIDEELVNLQDKDGKTALHYACEGGNSSRVAVAMLLKAGADPDRESSGMFGTTPRKMAESGKHDELQKLFKDG